jgi:hypothetical protein
MPNPTGSPSPRLSFWLVAIMLGMLSVPAYFTLHTAKVTPPSVALQPNPSPYGYTVSLLLFIIPVAVIAFWLIPRDGVKVSKKSLIWTIGILFPLGAALDFFFASIFFTFPNAGATLGIPAWALHKPVPIEEYVFYFTGFLTVVLLYVWLDEYWLSAYTVPGTAADRVNFDRLLRFHPESLILAVVLIAAAFAYRRFVVPELPGFPGYFMVIVIGALLPSSILLPSARPVVNWRAFSLTMFMMLLVSLLWEVTLALPYGWWNFQDDQMIGLRITAWARLPIEEIVLWLMVSYTSILVYETVKRWKGSGRSAAHAFFGVRTHHISEGSSA